MAKGTTGKIGRSAKTGEFRTVRESARSGMEAKVTRSGLPPKVFAAGGPSVKSEPMPSKSAAIDAAKTLISKPTSHKPAPAKPHSVRMDERTRNLIDAAAEISGQSRTEFMLSSARQQAMAVLLEQRLFRLSDADWTSFQRALDEPAAPNEELKALMTRKPAWEK